MKRECLSWALSEFWLQFFCCCFKAREAKFLKNGMLFKELLFTGMCMEIY